MLETCSATKTPSTYRQHREQCSKPAGVFGGGNTLETQADYSNLAANFLGSGNTVKSAGAFFNGARNIVGDGNELSAGGPGSNFNAGFNDLRLDQSSHSGPGPARRSPVPSSGTSNSPADQPRQRDQRRPHRWGGRDERPTQYRSQHSEKPLPAEPQLHARPQPMSDLSSTSSGGPIGGRSTSSRRRRRRPTNVPTGVGQAFTNGQPEAAFTINSPAQRFSSPCADTGAIVRLITSSWVQPHRGDAPSNVIVADVIDPARSAEAQTSPSSTRPRAGHRRRTAARASTSNPGRGATAPRRRH